MGKKYWTPSVQYFLFLNSDYFISKKQPRLRLVAETGSRELRPKVLRPKAKALITNLRTPQRGCGRASQSRASSRPSSTCRRTS